MTMAIGRHLFTRSLPYFVICSKRKTSWKIQQLHANILCLFSCSYYHRNLNYCRILRNQFRASPESKSKIVSLKCGSSVEKTDSCHGNVGSDGDSESTAFDTRQHFILDSVRAGDVSAAGLSTYTNAVVSKSSHFDSSVTGFGDILTSQTSLKKREALPRRGSVAQLTVAVDIDEVLGSFLTALNSFVAEQFCTHHKLSDYHVYNFTEVWRCSQTEADQRVHAFFGSEQFNRGILPIPGAYRSLLQIAAYCQLFVVTSRQNVIRAETLAWIERHYSGIFKEVHFGNHFALEGKSRPKSEICRFLGAEILIDDNPRYAIDCAENGIEVLLFDYNCSYPWSKTPDGSLHPLITRVHDWQEVEFALRSRLIRELK